MGTPSRRAPSPLDRGSAALCLCLTQARTPDIVLVARAAGFDAVYVDLEHGVTPLDITSMLCTTAQGVGVVPFVRVSSHDPATITRVLDGGALGIIVPHVETPEQARSIVDVCRFPPIGRRSLYGMTPTTGYVDAPSTDIQADLDASTVVTPLIESAAAVENADKIAAVDGVDLLLVGVHDLSADLGVAGRVGHAAVRDALFEVGDACAAHGRALGVAGLADRDLLSELSTRGLRFVSAGTDVGLLRSAAQARVIELRSRLDPEQGDS